MKAKLSLFAVAVLLLGISPALSQGSASAVPSVGQEASRKAGKPRRRPARRGVPKGVQACLDRLIEIASADPLPAYGGQAQQIINDGLLWNSPKSRCYIGDDQGLKTKLSETVTAWQTKDADKVRSLLQELKGEAPQN